MSKRGAASAQPPSESEGSDGDEFTSRLEELRHRLRQQDVVPWRGRRAEISACRESIERKTTWPAIAAITASGCCACNTLHVSMLVFAVVVAGSALIKVGGASSPTAARCLTAPDLVARYPKSYECVATLGGDLVLRAEYSGDAGDVETGDGPLAESGFLSLGEQGDIDGSVETPPEPGFSIGESAGSTRHSAETGP